MIATVPALLLSILASAKLAIYAKTNPSLIKLTFDDTISENFIVAFLPLFTEFKSYYRGVRLNTEHHAMGYVRAPLSLNRD